MQTLHPDFCINHTDAVLPTNEPPLSNLLSPNATPSQNNALTHPTVPSPEQPPKKPRIKRRTLADWKSRKEKERIAQALLRPLSTKLQCHSPASADIPPGSQCGPKGSRKSSTALHNPADVHMDTVDGTGSSKPSVYELPKDPSKTMVSPKEPE
jgi:hypothetical protein